MYITRIVCLAPLDISSCLIGLVYVFQRRKIRYRFMCFRDYLENTWHRQKNSVKCFTTFWKPIGVKRRDHSLQYGGGGGGGNRMASLYEYRISIAMLAGTVVRTVNGLLIDRLFMLRDYDSTVQFSHLRSLLIFSSYIVIICLPFLFFITSFLFLDFSHAYITPFPSRWR